MRWKTDEGGTEFAGPKDAFKALKERAQKAIDNADADGVDVRQVRTRLRDDRGDVLFEGTLEEAARLEINGRISLPAKPG